MERTKKSPAVNDRPWWQKLGGGSLRMGNRIIKPNERFQAYPDEISEAFRKFIIPLSGNASFKPANKGKQNVPAPPSKGVKPIFTVQPHGDSETLFDVVSSKGKILNEEPLKKNAAESFANDLNK